MCFELRRGTCWEKEKAVFWGACDSELYTDSGTLN